MTDFNEADKDKKKPDEVPAPEGEENPQLLVEESQDLEEQQGTEGAGNDPLMELRQSLVSEEPEPEPKQDFLHRMTGTLGSKKTSGKPKESGFSGTGFGVRTTGTAPEGPDTSSMQAFRNTPQAGSEPGQPKGEEEEAEPGEPVSRVRPFEPEDYSSARSRGYYEDLEDDKSSEGAASSKYPFTGRGEGPRMQRWDSGLEGPPVGMNTTTKITTQIQKMIGRGTPILLEFQSPY